MCEKSFREFQSLMLVRVPWPFCSDNGELMGLCSTERKLAIKRHNVDMRFWPLLPAATKLDQGNVFTGVCDSVHRGVGWGLVPGGGWSAPGGWSPIFLGSPIFWGSPIFRRGGLQLFGGVLNFFFQIFFPKISSGMHQPPPIYGQ